jgi:hypothetical protein
LKGVSTTSKTSEVETDLASGRSPKQERERKRKRNLERIQRRRPPSATPLESWHLDEHEFRGNFLEEGDQLEKVHLEGFIEKAASQKELTILKPSPDFQLDFQ